MSRIPAIIPVSDLRQDAASVLKKLRGSRAPVVITQRGRAAGVLISMDEYKRGLKERELLQSLAQGEKDLLEGDGFTLSQVMKDADRLLDS